MSSSEPQIEAMLTPQTPVIAERGLKKSSCNYVAPLEEQKSEGRIARNGKDSFWSQNVMQKNLPALKVKSKSRKIRKKHVAQTILIMDQNATTGFSRNFGVHSDI